MTWSVVVADDDPDIRALVGIAAGKAGLDVLASVADGRAALEAIRQHKPDLAILDISMPDLTGLEVVREARADDSLGDLRIVLLSASVDDVSQETGLRTGADYFMTKPFSPRELAAFLAVGKEAR
jgi:DNA-binding response OmpR family regulator